MPQSAAPPPRTGLDERHVLQALDPLVAVPGALLVAFIVPLVLYAIEAFARGLTPSGVVTIVVAGLGTFLSLCSLAWVRFRHVRSVRKLEENVDASNPVRRDVFRSLGAPPPPPQFVGRSEQLAALRTFYMQRTVAVVGLIGWGGTGKSALAMRWLEEVISPKHLNVPVAVWWSFAERPSTDEFVEAALACFSEGQLDLTDVGSTWARISKLKVLMATESFVLVLDGLEALQYDDPRSADYGHLRSPDLRDMLLFATKAARHRSFCLITSRLPLTDLAGSDGYKAIEIEDLPLADGVALVKKLGIRGSEDLLRGLVERHGGHALTLTLMSGYLAKYADGNAEAANAIPQPTADPTRYGTVHQMLGYYEERLTDSARDFLALFSAFRTGVSREVLDETLRRRDFPLAQRIAGMEEFDFTDLLDDLCRMRLLRHDPVSGRFSTHPITRDYYRSRLSADPSGSKAVNHALRSYFLQRPVAKRPEKLEDLSSRFDALFLACDAQEYEDAFDIWFDMIQRGQWLLMKKFGAHDTDLSLIRPFFPNGDWNETPFVREPTKQAELINAVAFRLLRLGRAEEASKLFTRAGDLRTSARAWGLASHSFRDLAEAEAEIGDLNSGFDAANRSLALALKSREPKRLYGALCFLAWVAFLRGQTAVALNNLADAGKLDTEVSKDKGSQYVSDGIRRSSILLRLGRLCEARESIAKTLWAADEEGWIDDFPGCHRVSGDLAFACGQYEKALESYKQALKHGQAVGRMEEVVLSQVGRARTLVALEVQPESRFAQDSGPKSRWKLNAGKRIWALSARLREQHQEAALALGSALQLCAMANLVLWEADARLALGELHIARWKQAGISRSLDAAKAQAERALHIGCQHGYRWAEADSLHLLGCISLGRKGDRSAAKLYLEQALNMRREISDPRSQDSEALLKEAIEV